MIHLGPRRIPAGRQKRLEEGVEAPCTGLAATLDRMGFPLGRLTTGTPPRLDARTIRYECVGAAAGFQRVHPSPPALARRRGLDVQASDVPPMPLSFATDPRAVDPASLTVCHVTRTTPETHAIVTANAHLLPQYESNEGKGQSPRYCPSLDKKVERFPQRCAPSLPYCPPFGG